MSENRYNKTPWEDYNDREYGHDADPSESYADLFQMRKMLYDQKIYDSTKANHKFTNKHLQQFKKNNNIRLFDNFSDEDIIFMMNTVAQNNMPKLNTPTLNLT